MVIKKFLIWDNNIRIDRYIRNNTLKKIPQSLLEKYLRKKLITLGGSKISSKTKVEKGEELWINSEILFVQKKEHAKQEIKKRHYDILYQDEFIIALNKPKGITVQGGHKIDASINDILADFPKINNEMPKIVHRLDKDTSGVLLLARTIETARFLAESFAERKIEKIYRALVVGKPPSQGKIDLPLGPRFHNGQECICVDQENGKSAVTYFKSLKFISKQNLSYVELRPITGRKHQLRAHMKHLNYPIHGDNKYGASKARNLALHAYSISLKLPNGVLADIKAPLPSYMIEIIKENLE